MPEPLTIWINVLPRLHRDPISAGSECSWNAQRDHEIGRAPSVRLASRGVHVRPWQTAAILVDVNVEARGRPADISTHYVHFGDIPRVAPRYDEIVGRKAVKGVKRRFEVLGGNVNRRVHRGVVVLVVENHQGELWHRLNTD